MKPIALFVVLLLAVLTAHTTRALLPSQVLNLTNWKITLPLGPSASPTEIKQPTLATFVDSYFYADSVGLSSHHITHLPCHLYHLYNSLSYVHLDAYSTYSSHSLISLLPFITSFPPSLLFLPSFPASSIIIY